MKANNIKVDPSEIKSIALFSHDYSDQADSISRSHTAILFTSDPMPTLGMYQLLNEELGIPLTSKMSGYAEMRADNKYINNMNLIIHKNAVSGVDSKISQAYISNVLVVEYDGITGEYKAQVVPRAEYELGEVDKIAKGIFYSINLKAEERERESQRTKALNEAKSAISKLNSQDLVALLAELALSK